LKTPETAAYTAHNTAHNTALYPVLYILLFWRFAPNPIFAYNHKREKSIVRCVTAWMPVPPLFTAGRRKHPLTKGE